MLPLPMPSITAAATAAGYDAVNMANDFAGVVWKSTTTAGSHVISIDLGSAQTLDAILCFGCAGATTASTIIVQGASDAGMTTGFWTSGANVPFLAGATFPSHGRGVGYWEATTPPPTRRYWKLYIDTQGAALTIARIAMGKRLILGRNFGFGAGFGVRDLGTVDWSKAGVRLRRRAAKLRTVSVTFPAVTQDEAEEKVQPLIELVAGQEPIVLVTNPEADALRQTRCYIGHLVGELGTVWARAGRFEWKASLVDLFPVPKATG
jgi:hypothetical protein